MKTYASWQSLACLSLILFVQIAYSQIRDDFSDGNFHSSPEWLGDTANFEVTPGGYLHLDGPAKEDTSFLITKCDIILNAQWTFYTELYFNPSSGNYADIYLVSDQQDLTKPLNGYFVRIGNTADEISLYKRTGNLITEIIDGDDDRVDVPTVKVRIKVTRSFHGEWELFSDTTGGSAFISEGIAIDSTHRYNEYFGIFCKYTSTRSDKFYFDEFEITGKANVDTISPLVKSLNVLSDREIELRYSEPVDSMTASNENNYVVDNGIGSPLLATHDPLNEHVVILSFANSFGDRDTNLLTVANVKDIRNNPIEQNQIPFTWYKPEKAIFRDIIINEFLPDPFPPVHLPQEEFIELFNKSSKAISMEGWQISDEGASVIFPDHLILPGEYLILCSQSDTSLFNPIGRSLGLPSLPSLNNSGDKITLLDKEGVIIDSVNYSSSWFKDSHKDDGGWSLELINPVSNCISAGNNWIASKDTAGGTPGKVNSVLDTLPDSTPPLVTDVLLIADDQLQIAFSEKMDSTSLVRGSYQITSDLSAQTVSITSDQFDTINISLNQPVDTGIAYQISISNVSDCEGNLIATPATYSFYLAKEPYPGEIVINEIYADPFPAHGLNLPEFVELYNNTDKIIDLSTATFTAKNFIKSTVIYPNEYLIITSPGDTGIFSLFGKVAGIGGWTSSYLTDKGKELTLKNGKGLMIDRVNYTDQWYDSEKKKEGGWSLELINPGEICRSGAANWTASIDPSGATPGRINSVYSNKPDTTAPGLLIVKVINDSIVSLQFDEEMDSLTLINGFYDIPTANVANVMVSEADKILLHFNPPPEKGVPHLIKVTAVKDCPGNTIDANNELGFLIPHEAAPGDIVINEVLFNPRTGGSDFVELYNNSQKHIDLSKLRLSNFDKVNDTVSDVHPISNLQLILVPNQYLLLTGDSLNIILEYPLGKKNNFLEMNAFPPYGNTEGTVILANNSGEILDRFDYREDMHLELLNDVNGVSLERLDFNRPTNDPENWHSAAKAVGYATPGYKNSQFQDIEATDAEVSISPEIFSPDNDGYHDLLNISYNFSTTGRVANVVIYDSRGRMIRHLVKSELLGNTGVFTWDGLTDKNERTRSGIYVLFFEAFTTEGDVKRFKIPVVLASN